MPFKNKKCKQPRILALIANSILWDGRVQRIAGTLAARWPVRVLGADFRNKLSPVSIERAEQYSFECRWIRLRLLGRLNRHFVVYSLMWLRMVLGMIWLGWWYRPSIVLAHEISVIIPAKWIARLTGAKIIFDAHELYREQGGPSDMHRHLIKYEDWVLRNASMVFACNGSRAKIMKEEYGAKRLPEVVPNYAPFIKYMPDNTFKEYVKKRNPAIDRVVLYQGGIQAGRGLDTLINSLEHLPENIAIVFVGGIMKHYIEKLQRLAIERGFEKRCFFYGGIDYSELCRTTPSADVGIVTYLNINRNNYFCAPNKIYEYIMAGVPIVGANLPPIRDFLETTQTGTLYDPQDPQSCARAILEVIGDSGKWKFFHDNALKHSSAYSWETFSPKLIALVATLLEED